MGFVEKYGLKNNHFTPINPPITYAYQIEKITQNCHLADLIVVPNVPFSESLKYAIFSLKNAISTHETTRIAQNRQVAGCQCHLYMYLYIYFRNVYSPCLSACLSVSLPVSLSAE